MKQIVESLRLRMSEPAVSFDEDEIFELIAMGCFLCCRDGDRGGNKNCAPETELLDG